MINQLKSTLEKISHRLFEGSLNYSPSFLVIECKEMAGKSLKEILVSAIGSAVAIGGCQSVTQSDVLEEVRTALSYQGDDGSHPCREYLSSDEFKFDTETAMLKLAELVDGADTIISFWLKEGHPFYPVFWDFAFLIEKNKDAFIFIGSSSD